MLYHINFKGTEGSVTLETPNTDDIGNVSIELLDSETGAVLSTAPLYRCANRLIGSLVYPQATVTYRTVGSDINGQPFKSLLSTKTELFVQDVGANFEVKIYGENPVEFEQGQTIALNLTVHNHHNSDGHYTFTAKHVSNFVEVFRPTSLVVVPGMSGYVNMIAIPLDAGPGLYTFTATVTDGCVIHSVSKDVLIEEPVRIS